MSTVLQKRLQKAIPRAPQRVAEAAVKALEIAEKHPKDSSCTVVLVRVLTAVVEILDRMDSAIDSSKVASASSDFEVLLLLLEEPSVLAELKNRDPLAGAKLRGLRMQMNLLEKEGGCVSALEAGKILGMSKAGVHKARSEGRILGLPRGQNQYLFPIWQFPNGKLLPGLKDVYAAIQGNEWMKASFMLSANSRLAEQTPAALLQLGQIKPVLQAAKLYGDHGAV